MRAWASEGGIFPQVREQFSALPITIFESFGKKASELEDEKLDLSTNKRRKATKTLMMRILRLERR